MSDSSKGSKGKQGKFLSKSKTLLDIIVDEESGSAYKNLVDRSGQTKQRKSSLRDRLRLRRSASTSAKSSSSPEASDIPMPQPVPASDVPLQPNPRKFDRTQSSCGGPSRSLSRIQSTCGPTRTLSRLRSTVHHDPKDEVDDDDEEEDEEEEEEEEDEDDEAEEAVVIPPEEEGEEHSGGGGGEVEERRENLNLNPIVREEQPPPITMSLMDLLEETDRQAGIVGKKYLDEEEEEGVEEEEIDEEDGEDGEGGQYVCCVCMVRHKGAAFIPCGHTFCRLCSRELWVSRGNCPLCNGYILEILDIF